MKIQTNRDFILTRKTHFDNACKQELECMEKIHKLKTDLYHAENELKLAIRLKDSCLDDMAFLEEFDSDGKEFEIIFKLEDKNIEITKGWRHKHQL